MTIIVAVKTLRGVYIASDTICSNGYVKEPCGSKWVECGPFWIGCAGAFTARNLVEQKRDDLSKCKSRTDVAAAIRQTVMVDKDQWKPRGDDGAPLKYNVEFLIATPSGITNISGDLGWNDNVGFAAIGSGTEAALGAYHAVMNSPAKNLPVTTVTGIMVEAAVAVSTNCFGAPWRHFLE